MSEPETTADKCPSEKPARINVRERNGSGQMSEPETTADKCPAEKRLWTNVRARNRCGQMSERKTAADKCPAEKRPWTNVREGNGRGHLSGSDPRQIRCPIGSFRPVAVEHGQCHQAASRSIASLQLNAFAEILALSTPRHSRRCSAPAGVSPGQLVTMNPGFSRVRIAPG